MAKEIAEDILNEIAKHSLELEKIGNSMDKRLVKELDDLATSLVAILLRRDPASVTHPGRRRKMLEAILKESHKKIDQAMSIIATASLKEVERVAMLEAKFALDSLNRAVTGKGTIKFASKKLGMRKVSKMSKELIIKGAPQKDLWARQSVKLQEKFTDVIREGWKAEDDIVTIVQRVRGTKAAGYSDGIMKAAKHVAKSLVRTSIQSIAQQTRQEVYLANNDVISGVQFLAVFDNRTTPVCQAHGGETWMMNESGGFDTGDKGHGYHPPPLHFNCRSQLIPLVKTSAELSNNKVKKVPSDRQSSLGKPVSAPKTADTWLKGQSTGYQKEVLGSNYDMWKEGKVSFNKYVTQKGRLRSAKELAKIYDGQD